MSDLKATDRQNLLHTLYGTDKGTMPAKSISWQWGPDVEERDATEAVIKYARQAAGKIYLDGQGEFQAEISIVVVALDGSKVTIQAQTYEGFRDIKSAGNQIFYKFQRAAKQAGFHWPW